MNAKAVFGASLPVGTALPTTHSQDALVGANPLVSGWSLIAVGDNPTPRAFNNRISATPPAAGDIPSNLTSLWAWDSAQNNWYFYAPNVDKAGTLGSYIFSKGYLNFSTANKTLDPATGFWVNKP